MGNNILRLNENGYELMKGTIEETIRDLPFGEDDTVYYLMGMHTAVTLLLNESFGLYGMIDHGIEDLTQEAREEMINQIKENIYEHEEHK